MKKVLIVVALVMFAASFAYAADCKLCSNAKSGDCAQTAGSRFCSGLCNVALGWTEIFYRPGKVVAEGGNPIVGFFRGLGYAIERTGVGAVEVVTFWTPGDKVATLSDCPLCCNKK